MTKIDIPYTYSTIYTDPVKNDCKQKEVVITGTAGKQILLEQAALNLMVVKSGIIGTAWVTVQYPGGIETKVAEWTETRTTYQLKSFSPGVSVPAGLSLTIRYYLTTSNPAYRSRMNTLNYTYSLVDVPVVVVPPVVDPVDDSEDKQAVVYIKCSSKEESTNLINKIKEAIAGLDISIYLKI